MADIVKGEETSSVAETTPASNEQMSYCPYITQPLPAVEVIEVEQVVAAQMGQKVIECDLNIPMTKPGVAQIIDVYAKNIKVKTVDILFDKVVIRGVLNVKLMYVADKEESSVYVYEKRDIKFTRDIEVEGACPDMDAAAEASVEYINYDFNECEPRKVHVTIILKCWTRVTTTADLEVMAMSGANEVGNYDSETQMAAEGEIETVVKEELEPTAGMDMSVKGQTGTITGNQVNVRTGPGTNYPSIKKMQKGDVVTIKEQAFGWYKVVLPDGENTGWIASWFVNTK